MTAVKSVAPAHLSLDGIWLPLITPFKDGKLDDASVSGLVRHYLRKQISGIILAATTGESLTLETEEIYRLVMLAAEACGGHLPLYLGLSGSNTARMVKRIGETAAWPIAGYLIPSPYYVRPSQEGLYQHFTALADASSKPIVLYNIPYRTGVNMANETILRLAAHKRIAGIKDCCANQAQSFDLLRARPEGFSVLTGEDALFYPAIAQGADGGILASAHIDAEGFAETRNAILAGDLAGALTRWNPIADAVSLLFAEPNPAPIKHWLWREGLIASPELRLPMTGISATLAAKIDRLAAEYKQTADQARSAA